MIIFAIAMIAAVCLLLGGCASAPPAPTADIPVPVAIDCKVPDPGPKPDLTELAGLSSTSSPQETLTVMGAALESLAQDDARLRALLGH